MSGNTNNAVLTPTIKVCVRRLPANMNSESFLSVCKTQCASHVWEGQGTLLYYVNGRTKGRKTTFSRAYVGFRGLREAEQFAVEWGNIAKLWAEVCTTTKHYCVWKASEGGRGGWIRFFIIWELC